ncbi:hypothetical protein MUN46_009525 [Mesosutterella sp. AGMB02718]|uniref:CO-methylating acetyl-CoA synthase n=1 Tax=Mesosutterella faecium TaxID=2925194 RepID=A0ABT7IP71_9BURK|nr:hypothetical protein [Mesosutterella sp. AGMB02718]MDL2060174.1 hypothetical protein [Mesosutterella sp. AGMB02718]
MSTLEKEVGELQKALEGRAAETLSTAGIEPAARNGRAGLILEGEARANLGSPEIPSARYLLYSNAELPGGDRVRLIGRELSELPREPVAFAQAAVLYGPGVTSEVFYQFMQRHQRLLDQPGFMVKTAKDKLMARVLPEAAAKGLEAVSATFLDRVHAAFPQVQAVDLLWVTGNEALVKELEAKAEAASELLTSIKAGVWKERGFDYKSCQLAGHCGSCADKKTCSSIRQMEARVKLKHRREAASQAAA